MVLTYFFLNVLVSFYSYISIITDGKASFPLVMVGGVLEAKKSWDIGKEVINCISEDYPGALPIHPKVTIFSFAPTTGFVIEQLLMFPL